MVVVSLPLLSKGRGEGVQRYCGTRAVVSLPSLGGGKVASLTTTTAARQQTRYSPPRSKKLQILLCWELPVVCYLTLALQASALLSMAPTTSTWLTLLWRLASTSSLKVDLKGCLATLNRRLERRKMRSSARKVLSCLLRLSDPKVVRMRTQRVFPRCFFLIAFDAHSTQQTAGAHNNIQNEIR